jgi:hypothetical protein
MLQRRVTSVCAAIVIAVRRVALVAVVRRGAVICHGMRASVLVLPSFVAADVAAVVVEVKKQKRSGVAVQSLSGEQLGLLLTMGVICSLSASGCAESGHFCF